MIYLFYRGPISMRGAGLAIITLSVGGAFGRGVSTRKAGAATAPHVRRSAKLVWRSM